MEACYQHSSVESVAFCTECANPICALCKFDGATGARCPTCAETEAKPSAASRSGALLSLVLAIGSGLTFTLFLVVSAVQQEHTTESNGLLGLVFLLPFGGTIAGLGFGLIARDEARRRGSVVALVGIAGNGFLLCVLLLLVCVGSFME